VGEAGCLLWFRKKRSLAKSALPQLSPLPDKVGAAPKLAFTTPLPLLRPTPPLLCRT
jgi:hypothetical protein